MEKKKNKKLIKVSIILYIVLIVVITGSTFAWFIANQKVQVEPDDISISADTRIQIANADIKEGEEMIWGSKLELTPEITQYIDITSDGLNFYFPNYLNDQDKPDLSEADSFKKITTDSDKYFITLRLKFRCANPIDLYLGEESFVKPKQTEKGETGDYDRPSAFGDISADYIAGAARVSFAEVTGGTEQLKVVWIPQDKVQLGYNEDGTASINANGEREENYGYITKNEQENRMEPINYTIADYLNGSVIVGNKNLAHEAKTEGETTTAPKIGVGSPVLSFDGTDMDEKELLIRIWVEGTDREADKALNGGKMLYNLSFVGISKGAATEEKTITYNDGLFYGTTEVDDLIYTKNGIDWQHYSNQSLEKEGALQGVNVFYVRKEETTSAKSGKIYKVDRIAQTVTLFEA